MGRGPVSFPTAADAVADADARVTILDDRVTVEDAAVYHWLRAHRLHDRGFNQLAIGTGPLPPAWQAITLPFPRRDDASSFLVPIARHTDALAILRRVNRELKLTAGMVGDDELVRAVASALSAGKVWVLRVRAMPNRYVTRTTPGTFDDINPVFGSSIDFKFVAALEGDQWLRGYVPMRRNVVIGASGMTVASGFDVGQWSEGQLRKFGFSAELFAKLKPFAHHPMRHLSKAQVVALVARLGPVPILTKQEADICDHAVFLTLTTQAVNHWNNNVAPNGPGFAALPPGWQTVWFSRNYQEGAAPKSAQAKAFRQDALDGKWQSAIAALRNYAEYKGRIAKEIALLLAKMPAEIEK